MKNQLLIALNAAVYLASIILLWSVGGWQLVAGVFLFGWGMDLDKRIKWSSSCEFK